ncbi:hypothetical protein NB689_002364 [Xanthomonas sacchari]|nr:hypothetical protein [Xanthomonas sacchari]
MSSRRWCRALPTAEVCDRWSRRCAFVMLLYNNSRSDLACLPSLPCRSRRSDEPADLPAIARCRRRRTFADRRSPELGGHGRHRAADQSGNGRGRACDTRAGAGRACRRSAVCAGQGHSYVAAVPPPRRKRAAAAVAVAPVAIAAGDGAQPCRLRLDRGAGVAAPGTAASQPGTAQPGAGRMAGVSAADRRRTAWRRGPARTRRGSAVFLDLPVFGGAGAATAQRGLRAAAPGTGLAIAGGGGGLAAPARQSRHPA